MTRLRLRALTVVVAAALSLGVAVAVADLAGFGDVGHRLGSADPVWLVAVFAAEFCAYGGYALAYAALTGVAGMPNVGVGHSARIVTAGFGAFFPAGGFALDLQALRMAGATRAAAREAVLGLGALEYAVLAPAAWVAALSLLDTGGVLRSLTLPWTICVPLGTVAAVVAFLFRERLPRWARTLVEPLALLVALLRRPRLALGAYGGMALYWAGETASLWAGLRVFGVDTTTAVALLGLATGYALTRRTLPLAGAGLTEAFLAYSLRWAGVGLAAALLGVVVYRFFNVWVMLPASAAAAPTVERPVGS